MSFQRATLKGTKAAVEADIKGLMWEGESVYPNYPQGYEKSFGPFERFVITPPTQEVLVLGEYSEDGSEITPPQMGDWVSHLVLPRGYDTESLSTIQQ